MTNFRRCAALLFGAAALGSLPQAAHAILNISNTLPVYPQDVKPDPWSVGTLYCGWSEESAFDTGGTIECKDGGQVLASTMYLGYSGLGSGSVVVKGQDAFTQQPSKLNVGEALIVGHSGLGLVDVRDGGRIDTAVTVIGTYGIDPGSGMPGRGTVTVTGSDCLWNAGSITIGLSGEGTVAIAGGAQVESAYTYLGYTHPPGNQPGIGTVVVSTAAVWKDSNIFSVGYQGHGYLFVQGQGRVESNNAFITQDYDGSTHSVATVQNPGSIWSASGTFLCGGKLLVRDGGKMDVTGESRINWVGLRPIAIVEDAGSLWQNAATLTLGGNGDGGLYGYGDMRIRTGGAVTCVTGSIQNGEAIVTDPGSRWTVSSVLHVGRSGNLGTLQVIHGGLVETSDLYVGSFNGAGSLFVADNGSKVRVNNSMVIGGDSPGLNNIATVLPGGVIEIANQLTMDFYGQLNLQGGTVKAEKLLAKMVAPSQLGVTSLNSGTVQIGQLLHAKSADKIVFGAGALDLTDGDAIFEYDVENPLAALRTQIKNGRNNGAWNGMGINSSAAATTPGTSLGIADASAVGIGVFAGVGVDSTTVLIKYTYTGDANLDGQVDINDLARLATAWQATGTWSSGDFDYTGTVDINDLAALATNWQTGVGAPLAMTFEQALASVGLGAVSVPEPGALAILAITGVVPRRRRQ